MILVFSGTQDGRELVYKLLKKGYSVSVSTATEYGGSLYEKHPNLTVYSDRLDKNAMINFINNIKPKLIIDASHPYATQLKTTIIESHKTCDVKPTLLRFERASSDIEDLDGNIMYVDTYDEAAKQGQELSGNILLTTGSKTIDIFANNIIDKQRIFARILPKWEQVKLCEDAGIKPSNIIAMQGPFSKEINLAMIDKCRISTLITKESGSVGGTRDKISAATHAGLNVIVIRRPKIIDEYLYFNDQNEIIEKVGTIYEK